MGKFLLLISDLDKDYSHEVNTVLGRLKSKPESIIIHYAYQIPIGTSDVITANDKIKKESKEKLNRIKREIEKVTENKIEVNLVMGQLLNTLKRALNLEPILWVYSPNILNGFKRDFENVTFYSYETIE